PPAARRATGTPRTTGSRDPPASPPRAAVRAASRPTCTPRRPAPPRRPGPRTRAPAPAAPRRAAAPLRAAPPRRRSWRPLLLQSLQALVHVAPRRVLARIEQLRELRVPHPEHRAAEHRGALLLGQVAQGGPQLGLGLRDRRGRGR